MNSNLAINVMQILASGVDTIYVGFLIERYQEGVDFDVLTEAKQQAGEKCFDSKGASFSWYGTEFSMFPSGSKGYEWKFSNADITVSVARVAHGGRIIPEVYIRFSSAYLWAVGYEHAINEVTSWLSRWAVVKDLKISRVDICIDVAMPMPVIDTAKEIVARTKERAEYLDDSIAVVTHYGGPRVTDYTIGKGNLMARIYNKSVEVSVHHKEWFRDIWHENGWDGKEDVVRFEFQIRRQILKEMSVDSVEDLKQRLADLWRYCTHDWLRVCIPGSKNNQSRWKVKDYWKLIQDGYNLFGKAYGVLRLKTKQLNCDRLMKQARGCLVSAAAVIGSGIGTSMGIFQMKRELQAIIARPDFIQDVEKRKGSFSNVDIPADTVLDEALRLGGEIEDVEYRMF